MIRAFRGKLPQVHASAFVEDSAQIVGDVELAAQVSVWFTAVLRGDINHIAVGARSNIQDGAVVHVTSEHPARLDEDVTIGHRAVVHGAHIGRFTLIGIGAIVLDGAQIGEDCVIAAGAVIAPGTRVPPRSLVMGLPGRVVRTFEPADEALVRARRPARNYLDYGAEYRREYGRE